MLGGCSPISTITWIAAYDKYEFAEDSASCREIAYLERKRPENGTVNPKIEEKLEEMDSAELLVSAVKMLPIVTHNISLDELTALIARFPEIKDYELIQDRIPYDGLFSATWVNGMDVLVPDWGAYPGEAAGNHILDGKFRNTFKN